MSERADFGEHWTLDPDVTFLNHGSFGACPRVVLEEQSRLRAQMEREPVRFFVRELPALLLRTREALGELLGASPEDLALVPNATYGVNTVLASLDFAPGDEVVVTDHEYNACRNVVAARAARTGARVVVAPVPFPIDRPEQVVEAIVGALSPRTKLVLIDHVTSQTGLVFPVDRVIAEAAARGIDVLVDGAHAPGMLPLDLTALGAAYYTGNLHKWLCAPKGAAFLHVRRDRQAGLRPLAVSHGANAPLGESSRFRVEADWTGTDDPTAHLAIPCAIATLSSLLPGGLDAVRAANKGLVLRARALLCEALRVAPPCPETMIGSLATVPLPDGDGPPKGPLHVDALQDRLWFEHQIEVPIIPFPAPPKRLVRVAAQLYNRESDYARLVDALGALGQLPT